ncbi:hypothetical protein M3J07_011579 [Ascochyta lentis]
MSSASRLTPPDRRPTSQALEQGSMASISHQAEGHCYFTGQTSAVQHSHAAPPPQQSSLYSPYLDGVGTLFGSASRKGSYDTNVDISEDEASTPQPDTDVTTPYAPHATWLDGSPNGGRPGNSPPTPRLTPVQKLPWLPPSEYPEFQRQRATLKNRNPVFHPYRPALEDTPMGSPVDTTCTSIEPGSGSEDGSAYEDHDHIQDVSSDGHTPSGRFDSDDDNGDRETDDQNNVLGQPFYSFGHGYLPEDAYDSINTLWEMASSMSNARHASTKLRQEAGLDGSFAVGSAESSS